MQISKRLMTVANAVKSGGIIADVGCDHALASIYMVKNGIADRVIAMDIGEAPLMRAKEHIMEYGVADRIETRISDGLEKLMPGEVNTVLISGMGGALMTGILQRGMDVLNKTDELVLSPQSEIFLVRRFLHEHGFLIDKEYMLFEQGKYYTVMHAVQGDEPLFENAEEIYGRRLIQEKNPVLKSFLESELLRINGILEKMSGNSLSDAAVKRKQQLCGEKKMAENVLELL